MNLTFQVLKKYFPELNKKVITRERILQVFSSVGIRFYEIPMEGRGCYVRDGDRKTDYVFLRYSLYGILRHETLCFEGTHALAHVPAEFLRRRHHLEAEVFSLVMMMPATELPRLNRVKHQLDDESYELVKKRNHIKAVWRI